MKTDLSDLWFHLCSQNINFNIEFPLKENDRSRTRSTNSKRVFIYTHWSRSLVVAKRNLIRNWNEKFGSLSERAYCLNPRFGFRISSYAFFFFLLLLSASLFRFLFLYEQNKKWNKNSFGFFSFICFVFKYVCMHVYSRKHEALVLRRAINEI